MLVAEMCKLQAHDISRGLGAGRGSRSIVPEWPLCRWSLAPLRADLLISWPTALIADTLFLIGLLWSLALAGLVWLIDP
jgi:hypothetical protein